MIAVPYLYQLAESGLWVMVLQSRVGMPPTLLSDRPLRPTSGPAYCSAERPVSDELAAVRGRAILRGRYGRCWPIVRIQARA